MNTEDILPGNRGGNRGRNMDNVENVDRTNNAQYSYRVRNPQIRFGKAYTLYITLKKKLWTWGRYVVYAMECEN